MNIILFKITLGVYFLATVHYVLFIYTRKALVEKVALVSTIFGFITYD